MDYCSKLIKKYSLDIENYPKYCEIVSRNALRYNLKKGWMACEERYCHQEVLLGYLIEELLYKKKFQESWSIFQRSKLLQNGVLYQNLIGKFSKKNQENKVLANLIFEKDFFNPMEENIGNEKPGHYLNLRDFEINEEKVYFIDDLKHENFELSRKVLENSEIVDFLIYVNHVLKFFKKDWFGLRVYCS